MLFGPKLNTVFASRWKALIWASFVLLTAYCAVPAREEAKAPLPSEPAHSSPWSLDPAK